LRATAGARIVGLVGWQQGVRWIGAGQNEKGLRGASGKRQTLLII